MRNASDAEELLNNWHVRGKNVSAAVNSPADVSLFSSIREISRVGERIAAKLNLSPRILACAMQSAAGGDKF